VKELKKLELKELNPECVDYLRQDAEVEEAGLPLVFGVTTAKEPLRLVTLFHGIHE